MKENQSKISLIGQAFFLADFFTHNMSYNNFDAPVMGQF